MSGRPTHMSGPPARMNTPQRRRSAAVMPRHRGTAKPPCKTTRRRGVPVAKPPKLGRASEHSACRTKHELRLVDRAVAKIEIQHSAVDSVGAGGADLTKRLPVTPGRCHSTVALVQPI